MLPINDVQLRCELLPALFLIGANLREPDRFHRRLGPEKLENVLEHSSLSDLCVAKIKNEQIALPGDYFQRMGLAGECSVAWLPSGATRSLESGIAMRTWLFVALKVMGESCSFASSWLRPLQRSGDATYRVAARK